MKPQLDHAALRELPLTTIRPEGWLRCWLEVQRDGLTGHLEQAGFPFNTAGWAGIVQRRDGPGCEDWWPYEQYAYWIDGLLRCGLLLGDQKLITQARAQIDSVVAGQDADGYFGPLHLKAQGVNNRWPHAIFARAIIALHGSTGEPRLLDALLRYAHHLTRQRWPQQAAATGRQDVFGLGDRDLLNIENILYAAKRVGADDLVEDCRREYERRNRAGTASYALEQLLSETIPQGHGVSFLEHLKIPALLFCCTGEKDYLRAAVNGLRKLARYHLLIDGVPSSCEEFSGRQTNMVHETCDIADHTWTLGCLLLATGTAEWADAIEWACFNAGLGCVTKDFTGVQYYSGPNQVVADSRCSHWNAANGWFEQSRARMAYRPGHDTECCTGNVHRIMPNYIARMWLQRNDGALVAALYGPSTVTMTVAGQPVTVVEETAYPFNGRIVFTVQTSVPVKFPLVLRIPSWCVEATIAVNGERLNIPCWPGFTTVEREFRSGDRIELNLPLTPRLLPWPWDGVAVARGPLLFSLPVPAQRTRVNLPDHSSSTFPADDLSPDGHWAFALDCEAAQVTTEVRPIPLHPWRPETTPVRLQVPALRLRNWGLEQQHTPVLPSPLESAGQETITLIPMGCTTLRLTIFPDCLHRYRWIEKKGKL